MSCYGIDAKPCNEQCHECERGDLDEIVEPNGYSQRKQCFQGLPVRSSDTVTEKVEYFVKRIEAQNQPGPPNSGIPIPPNMSGSGKINITVQERFIEVDAVTPCERKLMTGESVRITATDENGMVVVEPVIKNTEK